MEIHQLRYFCAVAETGSFTEGARKEHVSQPSLSQQIIKLEGELGSELFERLGRATRLTLAGKIFCRIAKSILNRINQVKSEMQGAQNLQEGSVTVGAIPTVAPYLLPLAVVAFKRKYPLVQLTVVEELPLQLLEALRNAAVDLAVLQLPVSGKGFVTEELLREPLYLVIPGHHRLASRKAIDLRQVKDSPFIVLREGYTFRKAVLDALRRAGVRPNIVCEAHNFPTIIAMVSAGLGVSMIPKMAIEKKRGCKFIPLRNEPCIRIIGLVRLGRHHMSPVQRLFLEHLRQSASVSVGRLSRTARKTKNSPDLRSSSSLSAKPISRVVRRSR